MPWSSIAGYPGKVTVSNTSGTRIHSTYVGPIASVRLEGTPDAFFSPNELRVNELTRPFIGIGNNGKAQVGSTRPSNGVLYPRKI